MYKRQVLLDLTVLRLLDLVLLTMQLLALTVIVCLTVLLDWTVTECLIVLFDLTVTECLTVLLDFLENGFGTPHCQECAMMVLRNMCCHAGNKPKILANGGSLLCVDTDDQQVHHCF